MKRVVLGIVLISVGGHLFAPSVRAADVRQLRTFYRLLVERGHFQRAPRSAEDFAQFQNLLRIEPVWSPGEIRLIDQWGFLAMHRPGVIAHRLVEFEYRMLGQQAYAIAPLDLEKGFSLLAPALMRLDHFSAVPFSRGGRALDPRALQIVSSIVQRDAVWSLRGTRHLLRDDLTVSPVEHHRRLLQGLSLQSYRDNHSAVIRDVAMALLAVHGRGSSSIRGIHYEIDGVSGRGARWLRDELFHALSVRADATYLAATYPEVGVRYNGSSLIFSKGGVRPNRLGQFYFSNPDEVTVSLRFQNGMNQEQLSFLARTLREAALRDLSYGPDTHVDLDFEFLRASVDHSGGEIFATFSGESAYRMARRMMDYRFGLSL